MEAFEIWVKQDIESKKWALKDVAFDVHEAVRISEEHMVEHPLCVARIEPVPMSSVAH